jgi:hypothetical protein
MKKKPSFTKYVKKYLPDKYVTPENYSVFVKHNSGISEDGRFFMKGEKVIASLEKIASDRYLIIPLEKKYRKKFTDLPYVVGETKEDENQVTTSSRRISESSVTQRKISFKNYVKRMLPDDHLTKKNIRTFLKAGFDVTDDRKFLMKNGLPIALLAPTSGDKKTLEILPLTKKYKKRFNVDLPYYIVHYVDQKIRESPEKRKIQSSKEEIPEQEEGEIPSFEEEGEIPSFEEEDIPEQEKEEIPSSEEEEEDIPEQEEEEIPSFEDEK